MPLLQRLRRSPRAVDALIVAALLVLVGQEVLWSEYDAGRTLAVLTVVLPVPALLWRRTAPIRAAVPVLLGVAILGLTLEAGELPPQTSLVTVAIAAYSLGAHAGTPWSLGLVLAAVVAAEPTDAVVQVPLYAAVWAGGRLALRYRRQAEQLAELGRVLERERAEHARLAIVEERARIARELHDVVAHSVSTMIVQAGAERLSLGPDAPESTRAVLEDIEGTGREALAEMRRLLGVLRSEGDEVALAPQPSLDHLGQLAERLGRAGLDVDVRIEGNPVRLPPGVDVSAYRIVQEALTNALRHSGAARARLTIRYAPSALQVEVVDEGHGGPASEGGHGLAGMRERVALYGGDLETGQSPAGGWSLRARLPLGAPA